MDEMLRDQLLATYQGQIAATCQARLRASSPADVFNQLNNVAEAIIKTISVALYAVYRDGTRVRSVDLILEENFVRPSVATYHGLTTEILRAKPESDLIAQIGQTLRDDRNGASLARFVNASRQFRLGTSSTRAKASPQLFFDEFIQFRHKVRGHGAPSAEVYALFNSVLDDGLNTLLARLETYFSNKVVSVDRIELDPGNSSIAYECTTFRGLALLPLRIERPLGARFLKKGAVYLVTDTEEWEMSPLLGYAGNDLGFLNEFRPGALAEYLVHHSGSLPRVSTQLSTREFFGLPEDLPASDIRTRNGIVFNVPPPTTLDFVGREKELDLLRRALTRRTFPIITLWGWGGAGKTALAQKLAYELLTECEDSELRYQFIVWVSAKKTELTPDGIRRLPDAKLRVATVLNELLRVTGGEGLTQSSDVEVMAREVRELFGEKDRILVIVDNFETFEDDKGFAWEVFKEVAGTIQFLVTSRHKRGEAEQPVHLAGLSEEDALRLLESTAREKDAKPLLQAGAALRKKVVRECDYLPLAIKTVAGWVTKGVAVDTALEGFKAVQGEGIHEFCFEESYELLAEPDRRVAFVLSSLEESATQDELHMCLDLDTAALEAVVESLSNLSIIETKRTDDEVLVIQMPNLPREYFRRRLNIEPQYQEATDALVKAILKARLDEQAVGGSIPSDLVGAGKAARLAFRYAQAGQFVEADRFWAAAVEANPTHAGVWSRFGYYQALIKGDLEEGLKALKKALMLSKTAGHTWFVRGIVERKLGRLDESLNSLENAERDGEEQYLVHSNRILTLFEMAKLQYRKGRRSEEIKLHEQIVALSSKAWASDDGDVRQRRHNAMLAAKLAKSLSYLGRHNEALAAVRKGLAARPTDHELSAMAEELELRARARRQQAH